MVIQWQAVCRKARLLLLYAYTVHEMVQLEMAVLQHKCSVLDLLARDFLLLVLLVNSPELSL